MTMRVKVVRVKLLRSMTDAESRLAPAHVVSQRLHRGEPTGPKPEPAPVDTIELFPAVSAPATRARDRRDQNSRPQCSRRSHELIEEHTRPRVGHLLADIYRQVHNLAANVPRLVDIDTLWNQPNAMLCKCLSSSRRSRHSVRPPSPPLRPSSTTAHRVPVLFSCMASL